MGSGRQCFGDVLEAALETPAALPAVGLTGAADEPKAAPDDDPTDDADPAVGCCCGDVCGVVEAVDDITVTELDFDDFILFP